MTEKIPSNITNEEQPSAEEKEVSLELPKEQLEQVLKKALDIDAYGTAFSVVGGYYPDSAKEHRKQIRKTIEEYRKTFEDFKNKISESGYLQTSGGHYEVPLIKGYGYGSRESMYQCYRNLKEVPDGKYYIDERLFKLIGSDSNALVSEKVFNDRYDELLEKDISEEYQKYSQYFEELISGKSFEKFYTELREKEKEFDEEGAKKRYEEYLATYDDNACKKKGLRLFESIFSNGIFGGRRWRAPMNDPEGELAQPKPLIQTPEVWTKDVRSKDPEEQKKKERHVFFNIVGKFHNDDLSYTWDEAWGGTNHDDKMKDSQWFFKGGITGVPKNAVAIIFDKEGIPYFSDDPNGGTPHSQHGYAGPIRIAPRKFLGVVVQCTEQGKRVYEDGSEMSTTVLSTDPEKWQRSANDLAETLLKTNQMHPDRLVPIYDVNGNMLWPKNLSHEEVKELIKNSP